MSEESDLWAGYGTDVAGSMLRVVLGNVHGQDKCRGTWCVLHHPSPHHMLDWAVLWNVELHRMDRLCPHLISHPDPDSQAYVRRALAAMGDEGPFGAHFCDGCCTPPQPDFHA